MLVDRLFGVVLTLTFIGLCYSVLHGFLIMSFVLIVILITLCLGDPHE